MPPTPSPVGRRRLPSADRRQQILAASETLFTERGFEAVSMADIAQQLGISRPTVYSYYATTADILGEILSVRLNDFETRLHPFLSGLPHAQPHPYAALFRLLVREAPLLTLLHSGSGPAFTDRRLAFFAELESRLRRHLPASPARESAPYLLTCLTLLLQATATHAITAQLSTDQTEQLALTLDRFLQAGLHALHVDPRPVPGA